MEATFVISVFVVFILGAGMLMLVLGYLSTEERRTMEERERGAQELPDVQTMAELPRFFARPDASQLPSAESDFDDTLLAHLESYLRSEQALVARFVDEPSIDNLYRQSTLSAQVH